MKRFLFKTFLLILPLIVLSYPADIFISNNLKQSHSCSGEYEVMSDLYGGQASCDIAIYGSSRAWVHINPQILTDTLGLLAYNFGIDAHNFWLQYLRHLALLKHNSNPRQIIVSVDVFTLEKRKDLYQMEQFLPFMLWDRNIRKYTSSYIGYSTLDYFIPLKRYIGQKSALNSSFAFARNKNPLNRARKNGFAGMDRKWNSDMEKALSMKNQFHVLLHQESIDLFDRFISECIESEIEIVLVYTPEYIEGQTIVANRAEILGIYRNMADKYDLLFIDYSDHEICLEKEYFYNASHLTRDGANIFTSVLAHDLKLHSQANN